MSTGVGLETLGGRFGGKGESTADVWLTWRVCEQNTCSLWTSAHGRRLRTSLTPAEGVGTSQKVTSRVPDPFGGPVRSQKTPGFSFDVFPTTKKLTAIGVASVSRGCKGRARMERTDEEVPVLLEGRGVVSLVVLGRWQQAPALSVLKPGK